MSRKKTIILFTLGVAVLLILITVNFNITGNREGLFLLKGKDGYWLEVKDDLYLNEGHRYIIGMDFMPGKKPMYSTNAPDEASLYAEWNDESGTGYVRNYLPGGRQMLTCLSRFIDDGGKEVRGLFVGGGLPANVLGDDIEKMNETGMAYYDGRRWCHIWCNVNEAIFSVNSFDPIPPSQWKFLGSRVLNLETKELLLESDHEVNIDGVPLRIDRYAAFRAGVRYFVLSIYITNIGDRPVTYSYQYGDEPWLGNYGSSKGNVGWTADGLQQYVGKLPSGRYTYAGFFDHGNDAIGEGRGFTGVANFLEWFGNERPMLYFSNGPFDTPYAAAGTVPISGNTRFIGLLWGPRTLLPDESVTYTLAIGMADNDPVTGLPVKPTVDTLYFP